MNKEVVRDMIGKLNRENNYEWSDIKEKYNLKQSCDHLRKMAYGMKKYNDLVLSEGIDDEDFTEKILKLQSERVKLQDVRANVNRMIRDLTRHQSMQELAKECSKNMSNKQLISSYKANEESENESILMISDMHIGLETESIFNKFNSEVAVKRMNELLMRTIRYNKLHNVNKTHIVIIGDLINGLIHTTTRIENRENIIEQVMFVSELLSEFICQLSNHCNLDIHFSFGNHGRIIANKNDNIDKENFEHFIKYMITNRCDKIDNVQFSSNNINDIIQFTIYNYNIVSTHGDKFGNKNKIVNNLTQMVGYVPNYVLLGHYHHNFLNTIGECEVICNSSFSGTDTYASNLGLVSRPSQNLLIINKDLGKIALYHLYLDKI